MAVTLVVLHLPSPALVTLAANGGGANAVGGDGTQLDGGHGGDGKTWFDGVTRGGGGGGGASNDTSDSNGGAGGGGG